MRLKENYFLDDGAYMSVVIISRLAVSLREGQETGGADGGATKNRWRAGEVRLRILAPDYKEYGRKILEDFRIFAEQEEKFHIAEPNYEGIRINFQDDEVKGWMLIRMSLHDPILPLNFEADREGGVDVMAERLRPFLERYTELRG